MYLTVRSGTSPLGDVPGGLSQIIGNCETHDVRSKRGQLNMELTYHWEGDYLIPDISLDDGSSYNRNNQSHFERSLTQ